MNRHFSKQSVAAAMICAAVGWINSGNYIWAQSAPADISPDVQEVLTLSRQHMDDSVITNYIMSTGKSYKLSAQDIIYLNNQGVSQPVINTLLQTSSGAGAQPQPSAPPAPAEPPAPAPAPTEAPAPVENAPAEPVPASPPPVAGADVAVPSSPAPDVAAAPAPTMDYFQGQLAPYGNWITVPGYGTVWQPAVDASWRPYYDGGHWVYTDAGWFWQSDYPWGDIPFHYGRWAYSAAGWVWVPGYDYAPSWVVWRHDDAGGFVGWAPLPPGAVFVNGGWAFNGVHVGVDFGFGLSVNFFTFVGYDHFGDNDYRRWVVPHDRVVFAFNRSVIVNHYSFDHGRFVNVGMPRDRMEVFTHRSFAPVRMDEIRHDEEVRNVARRNDDIHNFRAGVSRPDAMGGHADAHDGLQREANGAQRGGGQNNHKDKGRNGQGQNGW